MEKEYAHCLRPTFTANLVKDLQQGQSLNLIGDNGQGQERLLADVKDCHLRNTLILAVNMKNYKQSYDGFVQALWQQLGASVENNLGQLVTHLEQRSQKIIFWLHDFDALLDNPDIDERYNTDFTNSLNSIKNHSKWSLVCVTDKSYRKYVFIVKGQPLVSPLELTPKPLPKLAFEEIRYELSSRNLSLNSEELAQVTSAIHQQKMPYQLLVAIADKLYNQVDTELPLLKRLENWKKEFKHLQPVFPEIRWWYDLSRKIRTWLVAAKAKGLIIELIHLIFHPLIVLAEKVIEFLIELVKRTPKK